MTTTGRTRARKALAMISMRHLQRRQQQQQPPFVASLGFFVTATHEVRKRENEYKKVELSNKKSTKQQQGEVVNNGIHTVDFRKRRTRGRDRATKTS